MRIPTRRGTLSTKYIRRLKALEYVHTHLYVPAGIQEAFEALPFSGSSPVNSVVPPKVMRPKVPWSELSRRSRTAFTRNASSGWQDRQRLFAQAVRQILEPDPKAEAQPIQPQEQLAPLL